MSITLVAVASILLVSQDRKHALGQLGAEAVRTRIPNRERGLN